MAKVVAEPGSVVGEKYRVVRTIGTGGMGVVYEARHIELGQRVALKLLQSVDDEEQVQRFIREARASARLKSDHAAKVVDVGRQKSGMPFMVMELLTGKDLGELCAGRPIPAATAVSFILQACEAVAEAHALGIVHRDLKPSNLFLTERPGGQPLVKVLDFGIAKMIRHEGDGKLTGTNAVMGSPKYMSPEQLRSSRDVDHRTDIWSLGICLYELVSGRTPFEATAIPELYVQVLRDAPVPVERYVPGLPPPLAAAIARCIEKDPALRFGSVFELASALEPFALADSRGSAARIARLLAKTGHSDPPPALEEAALAAASSRTPLRQMEETVLVPRERSGSGWIVASVFGMTALAGIGVGAIYLSRTSARAAPIPELAQVPITSAQPEPTPIPTVADEPPAASPSAAPEVGTTSTPATTTPLAEKPATAARPRTSAAKPPGPGPGPAPAPAPPSELKTKFE